MTDQQEPQAGGADPRPRPAYGEYAPEGWEWKPEGDAAPDAGAQAGAAAPAAAAPAAGVPHNLGVTGGAPQPPAAGQQGQPYRAAPPQQGAPNAAPYGQTGMNGAERPRTGDKVVTVLLLVFGALGALISAQGMFTLATSFSLIGDVLSIENFTPPSWVAVLGTVSGFALLALYACVLIFSLRRLRARKLTFWVPLVAGIIAIIATFIITSVALSSMPEIMEKLNDPAAMQQFYDDLLARMTAS